MNEEFEKRMKILRNTHREELEVEKHKPSSTQENTNTSIGIMESIKSQAFSISEDIDKLKNNLLVLLIDIRVEWKE
jgi:hypothetical protein